MHRTFRLFVLLMVSALLLGPLPACDRGDDVTPPIIIQTPEPVRGVIVQASFSDFETDSWFQIPFEIQTEEPGVVDITVNWSSDESWIYVYFNEKECTFDELNSGTCPFLIRSETKEPKPRILYTELLQPGTYHVTLYNVPRVPGTDIGSDVRESVSLQLGLTIGFQLSSQGKPPVKIGEAVVLSSRSR